MASSSTTSVDMPDIYLLCMEESFATKFESAAEKYFPSIADNVKISVLYGRLDKVPETSKFDAIVSPANSYGRLDGAFDDAISKALSPKNDYHWVTRKAQGVLYEKWKGFAPPGTCTVVPLIDGDDELRQLQWATKYILLCPTMRIPQAVTWDREVIYECIWSMLCAIETHNMATAEDGKKIKSILMTPLATGVGQVSYRRWAEQCVLALKQWIDASQNPERWSNLSWGQIFKEVKEVRETWQAKKEKVDG